MIKRIAFCFLACALITPLFFCASNKNSALPPEVSASLDSAGVNRVELEKVIDHYKTTGDTLKLRAAYFLIANMDGHSYVTYVLKDTLDKEIQFDALSYPTYDSLTASFGRMEKQYGVLDFKKKDVVDDLKAIKADFLINQIDYAFRAWREKPWAAYLNFDQFCEFILPYRGSNETLENWRQTFWDKYINIELQMANKSDPVEAAKIINKDIITWFKFDPIYYYHPTDQGLDDMITHGKGRCEDMTNITIYAMRANGLAVTSDYTPFWANSGNNHAWNAIVDSQNKVIPFMGAECNPGDYRLANKLAKVYRKTYSKQPNNLVYQTRKQKSVPGWLGGKSYADVTKDYVNTCNVTIRFEKPIPDSVDIAYICVFNSGEWQAIQWGRIVNDSATFPDMGLDIAYLPALYLNGKIEPWGDPIIVGNDCKITALRPDSSNGTALSLISTTQRKQEISTDGITKTFLTPGTEYELNYWNDGWNSFSKIIAKDKPIVFKNVPSGALYWLTAKDSDKEERIFTIENGQQVWW